MKKQITGLLVAVTLFGASASTATASVAGQAPDDYTGTPISHLIDCTDSFWSTACADIGVDMPPYATLTDTYGGCNTFDPNGVWAPCVFEAWVA